VSGADVARIGLTGQMHGLTLLDRHGEVLRPAILWNDQRTGPKCDEIRDRLGKDRLIEIAGNSL
jgi:xylulokinase